MDSDKLYMLETWTQKIVELPYCTRIDFIYLSRFEKKNRPPYSIWTNFMIYWTWT